MGGVGGGGVGGGGDTIGGGGGGVVVSPDPRAYILGAVVMELGTKTPCTRTEYVIHSPASQREEVAAALREYRGILTRKMLKKARDADEPIVLRATCYSGARFATCRLVAPEQRPKTEESLEELRRCEETGACVGQEAQAGAQQTGPSRRRFLCEPWLRFGGKASGSKSPWSWVGEEKNLVRQPRLGVGFGAGYHLPLF